MELWQRFTSHARAAVLYAHEEATRKGHALIATDHVLFGLLSTAESGAEYKCWRGWEWMQSRCEPTSCGG
jgi:hypothetical protein